MGTGLMEVLCAEHLSQDRGREESVQYFHLLLSNRLCPSKAPPLLKAWKTLFVPVKLGSYTQ